MIKKISWIAIPTLFAIAPFFAQADVINHQPLSVGSSGTDVTTLQTFLAGDASLYPQGLVTGYFGVLTKTAVSNFQVRNGIQAVGVVGPITLPILNLQIGARQNLDGAGSGYITNAGSVNNGGPAPIISNMSVSSARNNASVSWNTDQSATGVVYYNTSPLNLNTSLTNVSVSGGYSAMTDSAFRNYQSVSLQNLSANTTYYYMVYSTDQGGNVSVSWPSTFQTTN